ncbi:mechanosensitive ion channel family protein [Massilia endophytica]|uniref:mechanosensitive ion channel family protein n=1 Tax=Massilia endophytica TaxID=2899220 RepID=UPI001E4DBD11|nr:mechanosensitive ion channel domain-containing protein [Massilia endophytica]UGQ45312.1 mechanosensitive ion channel [Massilia endophytica]
MKQIPLSNLINDLLGDLRDPGLMWQLGALVVAIVLGWTLSGMIRSRLAQREVHGVQRFGVESFGRVVGPLAIVCLLAAAQVVLQRWHHVNLLKVALPIFGSLAVIRFVFFLLRRVFARQGQLGAALLTFEKIFQLLVWLAFALYITGLWDDIYRHLDAIVLPLGKYRVSVAAIFQGAISVVVLLVLAMWAGAALEERLMNMPTLHTNLRVVLARTGRALLILVSVLLSLSLVGIDLTVLSVFGGALGVGLGLGLQKIASNYVSGFIILLDRSLTIGDMITVDKFSGQVTRINTRYTVLQGLDGVESIVPNEMFVSSPVQNSSLSNKMLALSTKVTVAYDSDLDQVLKLLEEAAASVERVSAEKPPGATLQAFGADGLELQLSFWISDPEHGKGGVTSDVNRAVWKALKDNRISLPFPQRELRILGPLPDVALSQNRVDEQATFRDSAGNARTITSDTSENTGR